MFAMYCRSRYFFVHAWKFFESQKLKFHQTKEMGFGINIVHQFKSNVIYVHLLLFLRSVLTNFKSTHSTINPNHWSNQF